MNEQLFREQPHFSIGVSHDGDALDIIDEIQKISRYKKYNPDQ